MFSLNKNKLCLAVLLALPFAAQAVTPDAGSILQQIKPGELSVPSSSETGLKIQQENGAVQPASAPFLVKKILITGNKQIDTATLHGLVADLEGQEMTLAQLGTLTARITDYYRAHGYTLARTFIPAQTIQNGIVEFRVVEADYGKIKLDNHSRVNDAFILDTLSVLKSDTTIQQQSLDHALLLLSDIPGVVVNATLKPGESVGTSDLLVQTDATPFLSGNADLDNYGNRYTGINRLGATAFLSNPLHHGDVLSLSGLTSGPGMNYARASYDTMFATTHVGGSVSSLRYVLGDTLSNLNSHGTAQVASVWIKRPFVRSRDVNLYGQLQYDRMNLADHIDSSGIKTDRHFDNWAASLSGDVRNPNAVNSWSLLLTSGRKSFDNNAAQLVDSTTARTQGSFLKWNLNLSRTQSLTEKTALYVALSGQRANGNLDSSQKMVAGGPYTVRAYDMGVLSGDEGYLGTIELRHRLWPQWQVVAFLDSEHVVVNRNPWTTGTTNATLSDAGLGLDWSHSDGWQFKSYLATSIGSTPVLTTTPKSVRVWLQLSKGF